MITNLAKSPVDNYCSNMSTPSHDLYEQHPSKFWKNWLPPPFPQPPLDMYPRPKNQTRFLKKQRKIFFQQWNKNAFESWNMNIQLPNLKIKGELASLKYFISAWWLVTDLIGILIADSRKLSLNSHV